MPVEDQTVHTAELVAEGLRSSESASRDTLTEGREQFAIYLEEGYSPEGENNTLTYYGIQQWYNNEPTNESSNEI